MATFAPQKKKFRKSPYTIDTGFLLSQQCKNSPKSKNIGTKGFWGKILQKWAYLEEIKSHIYHPI
jgi:hypothetical protein